MIKMVCLDFSPKFNEVTLSPCNSCIIRCAVTPGSSRGLRLHNNLNADVRPIINNSANILLLT